MAAAILFNLAADIIFKLRSSALREYGSLWGSVKDEFHKLLHSLSAIQAVLHDAEEKHFKNHAVKVWVSRLKDVLYEIDDLIDEVSYEAFKIQVKSGDGRSIQEVSDVFSKCFPISFRLKASQQIMEIRQTLRTIIDDKNQFSFSKHVIERRDDDEGLRKRRETHSFILEDEVIGRNDDKEAVIDLLLNSNTKEDIAIVSIVGMGGLGKTALAQSIYNHKRIMTQFHLKLWVCVSDEFDLKIIIQKMIESATKQKPRPFLQIEPLQCKLKNEIDGKKYLLVMDDVWNEEIKRWLHLKRLLMDGAKGSRILITTRSEQVAKTFDSTFIHSLQILDASNSWLLFQKITGLEERSDNQEELDQKNSNLIQIGKEIVSRLKGVPLVIRIIGGLLKDNKSERFWSSFMENELYSILGQGLGIEKEFLLTTLGLSFKYLPAILKQCFLYYCTLFPKDFQIEKDVLIRLWRAQGFIQPKSNENFIDIGEEYFLDLLSRSFFQEVLTNDLGDITAYRMHDLMHDFGCWIMNNECMHVWMENDRDKIRINYSSLEEYNIEEFVESLKYRKLIRTLIWRNDPAIPSYRSDYNDREVLYEKIFHNLLRLRTLELDLSKVSPKLVQSIGRLKHLRYLNICVNEDIEYLPHSITNLYFLETLILRGCTYLKNLPRDIKNWKNLTYFDLSWNVKMVILPNSITELDKLETLILKGWKELKELPRDIKKLKNVRYLDLSSNTEIEFLPDYITELYNLETLILNSCSKLKELPRSTKNWIKLKHLDMHGCTSLTHMPRGLCGLTNLQTMNLFVLGKDCGCGLNELDGLENLRGSLTVKGLQFCTAVDMGENAKYLRQKSGLQELKLYWNIVLYNQPTINNYERVLECFQPHSNLQEILIHGYNGVELCDWVSSNSLGRLVSIELSSCRKLHHLPHFDQLPYLKRLHLENLPCIEYIIDNNDLVVFPSLEKLSIVKMSKLKKWWRISGSASQENYDMFPIIFPCLSELKISGSASHPINMDEYDVPWESFESLTSLTLCHISKLEYMSKYLHHTTLQHFSLQFCLDLTSLPEWIVNHTQLSNLWIDSCPNLRSLPESMANLTSLTELKICSCEKLISLPRRIHGLPCLKSLKIWWCPKLKESCEKEDWPNIDFVEPAGLN